MDLNKARTLLNDFFENTVNVRYDVNADDEMLTYSLGVETDAYDDPIDISVVLTGYGSLLVYAQFSAFSNAQKAYPAINGFNLAQPVFKALINSDNRLELQHAVLEAVDEEQAVHVVDHVISSLIDQRFVKLIQPLTKLTDKQPE